MVKEKPKTIQIQLKQPPIPPPLPPIHTQEPVFKLNKARLSRLDFQSRAKTIRIGKVRWPPAPNVNLTFEYELQKLVILNSKLIAATITKFCVYFYLIDG